MNSAIRLIRAAELSDAPYAYASVVEDRSAPTALTDELDARVEEHDDEYVALDLVELERLKRTFEASPWGGRKPVEVEREIHLPFDGRIVICKIDAIYQQGDRYEVVDWKTGKQPKDAADLERKQLQLALYRLAYAKWSGIDPDRIDAAFYFVADDRVVTPARIFDEDELVALWRASTTGR